MKKITIILLLLLPLADNTAQIIKAVHRPGQSVQAEQWQVTDLRFKARKITGNPFEVTFGATYKGPEGKVMRVPGFYDGNDVWVSRFSSGREGVWEYETFSSVPELAGKKGRLTITKNTRPDQHGQVMIDSERPQAFVYEDGTPHFMLAFELDWLFALDYDNAMAMPKTEQLLQHVRENGFSQVVMNLYAYDVGWKIADQVPAKYFYGRPSYTAFEGTNEKPDFTRLNLKLFQHLDRVFTHLQKLGLDAHLMIYVWNKKVNWPDMYSNEDNRFFDYVISRYQAFSNTIWDVSKEALDYGRCDIPYINERIARIRRQDAFGRLVTVHDYEYNSREPARVDFISIQSWRSGLYASMLESLIIHQDKPVVNIEHGGYEKGPYLSFEGNYTAPETCLSRAYECVFAGVYGSYYWQDTSWNIVVHDPFAPGQEFAAPRFDYYKHMQGLFSRYRFDRLRPSKTKITTNSRVGEDNLATNGFALSDGKGIHLMLIPAEVEKTNVILPQPPNRKVKATWFNPFTGEYRPDGKDGVRDWNGWMEFSKPVATEFAVLVIETP